MRDVYAYNPGGYLRSPIVAEQPLSLPDVLPQRGPEPWVGLPGAHMIGNSTAHDLGHRLAIHGGNRGQIGSEILIKPEGHRVCCHDPRMPNRSGSAQRGTLGDHVALLPRRDRHAE